MFNLIKMDVYRLFRSKALRVGMIVATVTAFAAVLIALGLVELFKFTLEAGEADVESLALVFPMVRWIEGVDLAEIVMFATNAFALFIGCMITASFVGAEQSCGYTKNIAGLLPNRGYTVVSKFVATGLSQLVIFGIYIVVSVAGAYVLFGSYINACSFAPLLACLGLRYLLFLAVNAVIIFFCTLTKSHAFAMVIGAVLGSGVTAAVYIMVNTLLGIMKIQINISHFMPDGINGILSTAGLADLYWRALVVSVVFIAAFISAAAILFRKRDVK